MTKLSFASPLLALVLTVAMTASAHAKQPKKDKTFSPYFVVTSKDAKVDSLPLKESRADVKISGVIAHVKVTQTYANTGKTAIEAIYVFPGSTRSAVFGMKMKIGERTIKAKIERKDQARKIYNAAKAAGKSASLLEQHRPNVFQMNVANIMPGDMIEVEMEYTELLVPEEGRYEFSYPAVVGPRFTGEAGKSAGKSKWTKTPYTKQGKPASYGWGMKVDIQGGVPIQSIASPSHKLKNQVNGRNARIRLADKESGGDRDFVLRYRLSGKKIESGLLLFPGEKENFFLMMMQPPARVKKETIPRREYVFILDVSGSMYGFPLETSKKLMKELFKGLNQTDTFNILFFSGRSALLSPQSLPATQANLDSALAQFNSIRGGGGTRLLSALQKAMALPTKNEVSRSFIVVTDGYISVEDRVFEHVRNNLGKANFFTFGIGRSVNRHLIDGMARVGLGEAFVALDGKEATRVAKKLKTYIESPVLTNIKMGFNGFKAYDIEPSHSPDLFAARPLMVFGKYRGKLKGKITVKGHAGNGPFAQTIDVSTYKPSKENSALRYLWARHRIAALSDLNRLRPNSDRAKEVTRLGLEYNLMTAYTSFIAVDSKVRNKGGKTIRVKQPLPLPSGVSKRSIGMTATGAGIGRKRMVRRGYARRAKVAYKSGGRGGVLKGKPMKLGANAPPSSADEAVRGPQTATIKPLIQTVKGSLTRAQVMKTLRRRMNRCNALRTSGIRGLVKFQLVVNANGRVKLVVPKSSTVRSPDIIACLKRMLRVLRFPKSRSSTRISMGFWVKF